MDEALPRKGTKEEGKGRKNVSADNASKGKRKRGEPGRDKR